MFNSQDKPSNTTTFTRKNAAAFINLTLEDANGNEYKVIKGAPIQADSTNIVDRSLLNKALAAHKAGQPEVELMFKGTIRLTGIDDGLADLDLALVTPALAANETMDKDTGEVTQQQAG